MSADTLTTLPEGGAAPLAPPSGARQVWRRLRARPAAVAGGAVVVLLVLVAAGAPLLAALEGQDTTTYHAALLDSRAGAVPLGHFGGISGQHWLGVEPGTGRDLFARLVYGARTSLAIALGATVLQVVVGVALGLAAGLGNRFVDALLSRVTDVFVTMPALVFTIALLAIVPSGFPRPVLLALVLGLLAWGGTAKIVRAQVLAHKSLDYVAASKLAGSSTWRTARRELLPALVAPVLTYAAIQLPTNIVSEAGLSFLGIGVTPPTSSWGQMLSSAATWYQADSAYVLLPALLLFVTVLAFTVFADGVRVALDPRAAGRLGVGTRKERRAEARKAAGAGAADAAGSVSGSAAVTATADAPGSANGPAAASGSSAAAAAADSGSGSGEEKGGAR
ncbi:ABC transporter permease [Actinacidiphila guanduensis]|uniref:Peptide/nickel transport system permease protein n=1 Tax=Actinacidiphila guanduensis TaxID=310781 RepID=A0A1H0A127_9ACTN|nr:ABC transporter permease [Actinacidiphila guanduensis]SDN27014.1 peptide/nickel transport system permease protein [Actinacidiphila guanduensis]